MSVETTIVEPVKSSLGEEKVVVIDETIQKPPEDIRLSIAKRSEEARGLGKKDDDSSLEDGQKLDKKKSADKIKEVDSDLIPIRVNEREIMVPKAKVDKAGGIVAYQKEVAVMQGFKDNAEQAKKLDQRERELAEREAKLKPELPIPDDQAKAKTDPPSPDDQTKKADLIRRQREAVLDGDDELADSLMSELFDTASHAIEAGAAETVNPDDLVDKVVIALDTKNKGQQIMDARASLYKEHPELKKDARLFQAVDDETDRVVAEHPEFNPDQVLRESYKRVQDWRGVETQNSMTEKQNEKRAMHQPSIATGRTVVPPKPGKPTNSDYVARLQKARGQS